MAFSDRCRRRLYAHLAVVLCLILLGLIKPLFEQWLDHKFPELAENKVPTAETGQKFGFGSSSSSERSEPTERTADFIAGGRADAGEKTDRKLSQAGLHRKSKAAQSDRRTGASDSRESGDEPPPGQLKLIGKNVFRSTAGLVYRPGSHDGHRLKHILKHAEDNLDKTIHGVFEGDRDDILKWIDLAWVRAGKGGALVHKRQQNDRTAWTVDMQKRIGYTGGQKGRAKTKPSCRYLRLVVEGDGKTVVTAYPVSSF